MRTEAEVISVNGNIATVRVKRSSMCDGCEKNTCEGSCSAASLMGAGKAVDAPAVNSAGAVVGDRVIVESSDRRILSFAAIVFLLPLVICAAAYAASITISASESIAIIAAFCLFILTFIFIGFFERRIRHRRPDIVVSEIIGQ